MEIEKLVSNAERILGEQDSVASIDSFIESNDEFVMWGAGSGGYYAKRMLKAKGKTILYVVDNDIRKHGTTLEGMPVKHPSRIDKIENKVIISSDWFMDIAKQLMDRFGFRFFNDFVYCPPPFPCDSLGRPFLFNVKDNIGLYEKVLADLGDNVSAKVYLSVLRCRLFAFRPELLSKEDMPLNCSFNPQFSNQPYHYKDYVLPGAGGVVLDCGAYTGDDSVKFAADVGKEGRVYAFEPSPETYRLLVDNVGSLGLHDTVIPVKTAISGVSGYQRFEVFDNQIASRLSSEGDIRVECRTIDDFTAKADLEAVDFVKMDIEGAEYDALLGAKGTIARHKPKLAISIYHKPEHLISIPLLIKSIYDGYSLYIKHNHVSFADTVCFATPGRC